MTQTAHPPHVRCPDCGADATLLPDGAIYCWAEKSITQRYADEPRLPDAETVQHPRPRRGEALSQRPSPDGEAAHRRHHVELNAETARRIEREYGYANVGLLVFVALALLAALVALALMV